MLNNFGEILNILRLLGFVVKFPATKSSMQVVIGQAITFPSVAFA